MAAAKKHSRKRRKNSFLCFFGGCFGISNKVSADHGDGKPAKKATGASARHGRALPGDAPKSRTTSSVSKEIHVVKESQDLDPPANEVLVSDKTHEIAIPKCKNKDKQSNPRTNSTKRVDKQDITVQETWSKPTKLSHSVSLPPLCQRTEKPAAAAATAGGGAKGKKEKEAEVAGEFDSVVGAVIIMVTLLVMLIWGKVWAILCTAAWFYFVPRFRENMEKRFSISLKNGVDLDSREYKKQVVLQGLLDRNQHR